MDCLVLKKEDSYFAAEDENGECDWMIGCENQEHLNDLIEKVQSELKILNFKDYSKEKDLTMYLKKKGTDNFCIR